MTFYNTVNKKIPVRLGYFRNALIESDFHLTGIFLLHLYRYQYNHFTFFFFFSTATILNDYISHP